MRLSKTSEYAILIVTFLAKQEKKEQLSTAKQMSETLNVPYKYLTQLMTQLVHSGIVSAIQGRNGGYTLAKKASEIFLCHVIESVEEKVGNYDRCILGFKECSGLNPCPLHTHWVKPKGMISKMLNEISVQHLVDNPHVRF